MAACFRVKPSYQQLAPSFIASLLLAIWAFAKNAEASHERTIATQNSKVAQNHATESRMFVNFLLMEVQQQLDPYKKGDKELIDKIAARVVEHFKKLDFQNDTPETLIPLAKHMTDVAAVMEKLTRYADAAEIIQRVCECHKLAENVTPGDQAKTFALLVRTSWRAGDYSTAESAANKGLEVLDANGQRESLTPDVWTKRNQNCDRLPRVWTHPQCPGPRSIAPQHHGQYNEGVCLKCTLVAYK